VTGILAYAGSFDYESGSGRKSRQFNFAVDVARPEPVKLTEHDAYAWTPVTADLPVTDTVKTLLLEYPGGLSCQGASGTRMKSPATFSSASNATRAFMSPAS
jgi:hypothetical protein